MYDLPELLHESRLTWLRRDAALGTTPATVSQRPQLPGSFQSRPLLELGAMNMSDIGFLKTELKTEPKSFLPTAHPY